ncbi:hypothetical protein G3N55_02740 [Dissulfurirhabdus thermomarina]|uniref:Manganese/iron superoxide dismutase C-terminal domain-containing protein n=1 Tax=Dissulfurirhabdus thermomarina TaxID=1765737 RepID=A0A6N9TMV5_DISTH|nr:Fe-Mn family superoxide dismutase [Dissulfurirhabdus thermomarina]NDY41770.1 hypothetical protein [Dissulfurirhabdus thermomarina]NMX24019.1 hypothetical protein [Dissulfurirhabdus thermomarina]
MADKTEDRRRFLLGLAGSAAAVVAAPLAAAAPAAATGFDPARLAGALEGFSASLIREHLALYETLRRRLQALDQAEARLDLAEADAGTGRLRAHQAEWLECRNALVLHQSYFGALTPRSVTPPPALEAALRRAFGSLDRWWVHLRATALAARAWAALVWDPAGGGLRNVGTDDDRQWPATAAPLLVVDLHEHAWVLDYLGRPEAYLAAWRKRVDWNVVAARLEAARGGA